ncbi:MAG: NTP transferase domain-containing protein [Phycisphaerales bacterium]
MGSSGDKPAQEAPAAIILAAGKGTRMNSDLPKVCHPVGGRAMVCAVVDACLEAGCDKVVAVVGYGRELVEQALSDYGDRVEFALQEKQRGTGDAVNSALPLFKRDLDRDVFVLAGDGPLIHPETLETLLDEHRAARAAATLATSVIEDPSGYGRIVRDAQGNFVEIVEQKNATPEQLKIHEVNPSYYCFRGRDLVEVVAALEENAVSGEVYITDAPAILKGWGRRVVVVDAVPPEDVLSVNTPEQLAEVDRIYRSRRSRAKAGEGAR